MRRSGSAADKRATGERQESCWKRKREREREKREWMLTKHAIFRGHDVDGCTRDERRTDREAGKRPQHRSSLPLSSSLGTFYALSCSLFSRGRHQAPLIPCANRKQQQQQHRQPRGIVCADLCLPRERREGDTAQHSTGTAVIMMTMVNESSRRMDAATFSCRFACLDRQTQGAHAA